MVNLPLCLWLTIALFLRCFLNLFLFSVFYSLFFYRTPLQPLSWLRSIVNDNLYSLRQTLTFYSNITLLAKTLSLETEIREQSRENRGESREHKG